MLSFHMPRHLSIHMSRISLLLALNSDVCLYCGRKGNYNRLGGKVMSIRGLIDSTNFSAGSIFFMSLNRLLSLALWLLSACHGVIALGSAMQGMEDAIDIQREQVQRMREFLGPIPDAKKPQPPSATVTFSNPAAKKFFVDGTKIPDVNFDAGPSWSGLMPISGDPDETRKLFFW
ncbi:hypothetical protein D9615_002305 [Tricholomella constricta]|uniref:Uncharacterized protein n=1 Tax=Tricholomella constricta TaxID=117010 RepID=A0A8H5HMS3_9AGAR|nr:hypothetical protein D9615_002305 [Tricholomella constricta]